MWPLCLPWCGRCGVYANNDTWIGRKKRYRTMITELAGALPPSAVTFGGMMEVGPGRVGLRSSRGLQDPARFHDVLRRFGRGFPEADPRAIVSYWTLGYFAALMIPAATALLCLDRVLPVGIDDVWFDIDDHGMIDRMVIADAGIVRRAEDCSPRFTTLVTGHLQPVIASCAAHGGLSPRVLWGNAAVILDFILCEVLATTSVVQAARLEAEALLGRSPEHRNRADASLFQPLRAFTEGALRKRRVCCLRYRIPGMARCDAVCPVKLGTAEEC